MRRKTIEETGGVPEEVVATVKASAGAGEQNGRRARNAVPDEVVAAVEQALANEAGGRRSRQAVTIGSEGGGGHASIWFPANEISGLANGRVVAR